MAAFYSVLIHTNSGLYNITVRSLFSLFSVYNSAMLLLFDCNVRAVQPFNIV